ncbi:MAG: carotenoid oxygenase family protein [Candidatus Eremiobacteraeota bacterium]|nr:carotenoid oxygenase family protein [Candidatus Eremiobacteraeota bacterium]
MQDFELGFTSVAKEQEPIRAEISGRLPDWLRGTLIRNGPAQWNAGVDRMRHWFDGFAMLHAFTLDESGVSYRSRFLRGPDWCAVQADGKLRHPQFATDPCRSFFKKVASLFVNELGCNPNVNVVKLGKRWLALTETPLAIEFDRQTLQTLGVFDYDQDSFHRQITSAHPVFDQGVMHNFLVQLGRETRYTGYRMPPGGSREAFAHYLSKTPGYLHSCSMTSREMLLWEGPFTVNPLQLLWRNRPYIENFRWRPELGSRLVRLGRDGRSEAFELPPLFVFHHVNAFYEGSCLCVDVLAYQDARSVQQLYLDDLLGPSDEPVDTPELIRVRVEKGKAQMETLSKTPVELPRISEAQGQPYRVVYGITRRESRFYEGLVRLDTHTDTAQFWSEAGCFAGEPVPQVSPDGLEKVLLSVVLDSTCGQSFLLVLDGETMSERARCYVPAVVPFGFHGGFASEG